MYERGKYITGEVYSDHGMPVASAVCFNECVSHADLRKVFSEVWGAGFFYVDSNGEVKVDGKSIGLKVESRGEKDEKMIARALGLRPS